MKKKRLIIRSVILLVMLLAIGNAFYNHFSAERGIVDEGDIAPNFVLEDLDGNRLELEQLRGKGVYLHFWATYCTYCRQKMQYLRDHYEEYQAKGVEIVAVNVAESQLQVERHLERFDINYGLYLDKDSLVTNAYGVVSLPTAFLIDEDGRVIEREIGAKTEKQVLASLNKLVPGN
ncbi:Peroxiredoxin [Evansella caseinilytica]|uniref:Peroxiredoxin n=1 Tax=Evansella caseinilytica TaxID=1503961 RepID=A0A1H3L996_9BACI|nr:thiol-disulfide oxidoreductase ResA [Evansella caseinilytica]SDY60759.1 Peroxiredoxin [Evansella caseinilytica]